MKLSNLDNGSLRQWKQGVGNHVLNVGTVTKIWTSEKQIMLRNGKCWYIHSHDRFEMSTILPFGDNVIKHIQSWPGFSDGDPTLCNSTQPLQYLYPFHLSKKIMTAMLTFEETLKNHDTSSRSLRFRYSSTAKWKMMSGTSDFNIRAEAKLRPPACAVCAACTMVRTAVFTGRKKAMAMTIVTRLCLGAILATWFDNWVPSCLLPCRVLGASSQQVWSYGVCFHLV